MASAGPRFAVACKKRGPCSAANWKGGRPMKDTHIRKRLDDGLSALSYTEQQHREMLNRIVYGGKSKVKKKASFSLALAVALRDRGRQLAERHGTQDQAVRGFPRRFSGRRGRTERHEGRRSPGMDEVRNENYWGKPLFGGQRADLPISFYEKNCQSILPTKQ